MWSVMRHYKKTGESGETGWSLSGGKSRERFLSVKIWRSGLHRRDGEAQRGLNANINTVQIKETSGCILTDVSLDRLS